MPTTANVPQPRDVAVPDFTSNTYVPFSGAITGNLTSVPSMLVVWAPKETRFVLRGGYIHVLCTVSCAGAASAGELGFYDEGFGFPIMPITSYHGTQTLVNWVNAITPWHFDLGKGFKSLAKNNRLLIGGTLAIGAGTLYCSGIVWGSLSGEADPAPGATWGSTRRTSARKPRSKAPSCAAATTSKSSTLNGRCATAAGR
jgi:hypothetical protein